MTAAPQSAAQPLAIAIVAAEESGDALGAAWKETRPPFYLETSCPGLFAAGDCRVGSVKRVAASVGEGSMAVTFVHRVLAL